MTSRFIDRLSIRRSPPGLPLMRQWWGKLLFMHWPVSPALLRPLVAPHLAGDAARRLRRRVDVRRAAARHRAGLARLLPHRTLLPLLGLQRTTLPLSHFPPALAAPARRSLGPRLDAPRSARPPRTDRRPAPALRRGTQG